MWIIGVPMLRDLRVMIDVEARASSEKIRARWIKISFVERNRSNAKGNSLIERSCGQEICQQSKAEFAEIASASPHSGKRTRRFDATTDLSHHDFFS